MIGEREENMDNNDNLRTDSLPDDNNNQAFGTPYEAGATDPSSDLTAPEDNLPADQPYSVSAGESAAFDAADSLEVQNEGFQSDFQSPGTDTSPFTPESEQPKYEYDANPAGDSLPYTPDYYNYTPVTQSSQHGYRPNVSLRTEPKPKKSHGALVVLLSVLLSAIISVSGCLAVLTLTGALNTKSAFPFILGDENEQTSVENVNINIDEQASSIAQAVSRKCNKSVVGIRVTVSTPSFFGGSNSETGEGSGVIYSKDGYIITNYHVIKQALSYSSSKLDVYLESVSTKPYSAEIIGYHIASDLAVLKINANNLTPIEIGDSDTLNVGQYAITIGAPGGLEFMGSVTYGVISGLNRVVSSDSSIKLIQTDAAINPGNSGGALLDQTGSLIGINSSKIVSEEFEGMGFAIPVNTVVKICKNIIENKDKAEPYVGITLSEKYTSDDLKEYGYPAGAVILSVAEGSTAETAGLNRGDIITKFSGVEITEYTDYYSALKSCKIGSEVEIEIYRAGRYYKTSLKVTSNSYGD